MSTAWNLVPNDTNRDCGLASQLNCADVFVHDRQTSTTTRVSVASDGTQGNSQSNRPFISASGRFIAFSSRASNLLVGDSNANQDVFVHDTQSGTTERVSLADGSGGEGNGRSGSDASISGGGRWVAFSSAATNLVVDDDNISTDVFVRDRASGTTIRLSVPAAGGEPDESSREASISADGTTVVFTSRASNLVPDDRNGDDDVFVVDSLPCASGTVNAATGTVADVLRVNGDGRLATVARTAPIAVELAASPSGPAVARYGLWIWRGARRVQIDLTSRGTRLGCVVNPTPFHPGRSPQPFRCLRGGMPTSICHGVNELAAPPRAPWTITRGQGLTRANEFTLQGLVEDAGAANSTGVSVTNAVILIVQ